jgi:cellulose synthase/poly-beta-1,6-N-acetylglucosamine synthase-like glycosyltransferase
MILVFWILLAVLFYTYAGYPVILFMFLQIKKIFSKENPDVSDDYYEPDVCLFVTAYNEKDYVEQKIKNSFDLDYPKNKVQYLWITDGSDDGTPEIISRYPDLEVYHEPARNGKIHAMNRGIQFVKAPLIIFSDTNTLLGRNAIREIVSCFRNPRVGCVAGEKRIIELKRDSAAGAGEGVYWKLESWIKNMDGEFNSAVGAVGELFAIRTNLYEPVENDTLLDDFIISLRIAARGFRIAYAPQAFAEEAASLNVGEELKRKIRIAAGGVQTIFRLKGLLNPFRHKWLTWQYFSHKVLRWTIAPASFFLILPVNVIITCRDGILSGPLFYKIFLLMQLCFYLLAVAGWYFENKRIRQKLLFIPYYFIFINYASVRGIFRFLSGKQSVNWDKSRRAAQTE